MLFNALHPGRKDLVTIVTLVSCNQLANQPKECKDHVCEIATTHRPISINIILLSYKRKREILASIKKKWFRLVGASYHPSPLLLLLGLAWLGFDPTSYNVRMKKRES